MSKTAVVGIREHGGRVTAKVVPDTGVVSLIGFITENVKEGATIVTDEHGAYHSLYKKYTHETVNHSIGQYAYNGFHTNGIENFWSLFKRGIIGIYHQISDKHLDKYVDEFEFRYNTRKQGERERFENMLSLCEARLTYAQLIAK